MKFKVTYYVGKNLREKNIIANNLKEAVEIAEGKFNNWEDVIMLDKTKGEEVNE